MRSVCLSLLFLAGCESGLAEVYSIDVADPVARTYSESSPGLLRVSGAGPEAVRVLCGGPFGDPVEYVIDLGFGCLDDGQRGSVESRSAWIEPPPEGTDAAALCALPAPDPDWSGVAIDAPADDLAADPSADWPQGTGSGAWERDLSPCGGVLHVDIFVR